MAFLESEINRDSLRIQPIPDSPGGGGSDFLTTGINGAVSVIDKVSKLPGALGDVSDNLNDELIRIATEFKNRGANVAEKNLSQNKINSFFRGIGKWVQDNKTFAGIAGIIVLFLIFRR